MMGLLRDITDVFDTNYWKVTWISNDGRTKSKIFSFKHEARVFYDALNAFHKRMERFR